VPTQSTIRWFEVDGLTVQILTPLDELPDPVTTIAVTPLIVIDTGDGPRACLTGARLSRPPICSGPRLIGLDIDTLSGVEEAGGTRFGGDGRTRFVGAWDGEDITLTAPPEQITPSPLPSDRPPAAPTGNTDEQLRAIQSRLIPVLSRYGGRSSIRDGWVQLWVTVIDRPLVAAFASVVDDPTPILLIGAAEVLG